MGAAQSTVGIDRQSEKHEEPWVVPERAKYALVVIGNVNRQPVVRGPFAIIPATSDARQRRQAHGDRRDDPLGAMWEGRGPHHGRDMEPCSVGEGYGEANAFGPPRQRCVLALEKGTRTSLCSAPRIVACQPRLAVPYSPMAVGRRAQPAGLGLMAVILLAAACGGRTGAHRGYPRHLLDTLSRP